MKWEGNRESDNVEDRRGESNSGGSPRGILGGGRIGIGTIAIALVASYFFGINPMTVLSLLSGGSGPSQSVSQQPSEANNQAPANDRSTRFVRTVLADTEDVWDKIFRASGKQYVRPKLDVFTGSIRTACGSGDTASGPFYCPGDQKVYIDLAFFQTMRDRFQVNSEFAQAYVIAHEIGHHVQHLTGISDKVDQQRNAMSEKQGNAASVKLELQADCFAGVWAFHANQARSILESGDIEGALKAASAIGDDTLQRQARGQVVPDSFTHGSSEQRVRWFTRGIQSGKLNECNTFAASQL
ncbi:KPN_02809 family neutral zinc metallopeptidase [Undibacterium sp. Ren11W]|uniref:KPN_02809 family neutral zinc metallopeptidase n=1 Tax=Undibacterium sp. Ren11W TaxID=3413045 RepID=UPI003BF097F6